MPTKILTEMDSLKFKTHQMHATIKTTIFGREIDIRFEGYADPLFHIESHSWDPGDCTEMQINLINEYIESNDAHFETLINQPVNPYA